MKTYVKEPRIPLPLFTQRDDGVRQEKAWACGECGTVYGSAASAVYCCKMSTCEDCGEEAPKAWVRCSSCREKRMWANAREIKPEDHDGPVYDESRDRYFESYDEAIEYFADLGDAEDGGAPEFVQPCIVEPFKGLDLESALMNVTEEMFDDAYDHLVGIKELQVAVNYFNGRNKHISSWLSDSTRKIRVVMPEAREEIEEWINTPESL